tara:strand:- start:56 stop:1063 length:1008 start_codon:yes stop_codon:yes gene_type:complete
MKRKKQNIANNLIKNPVDLRSQKSRAKGQGQSLNSSLGAPLAAGYFSNGRSNRDVNPIDTGGASQIDIPGEGFTDEAYQPPNFNPCPPGYTQNPGATGDYDDPYCIPSTNMPGGESFIPGVGDSLGMAFEGAFGNSIPAGDPFADGPEDQPGFGEWEGADGTGWHIYGDNECPIGYVLLPTGECVSAGAGGGWANYQDYNPFQGWHGGFLPYSNLDHWGWDDLQEDPVDYSPLGDGWQGGQEYTLDVTSVTSPSYCQENSGTSAYLWDPETETCWANVGLYLGTCPDGQSWSDQLEACVSTDNFMSGQEIEWDGNYGFQCPEGQVPGILGGCVDA